MNEYVDQVRGAFTAQAAGDLEPARRLGGTGMDKSVARPASALPPADSARLRWSERRRFACRAFANRTRRDPGHPIPGPHCVLLGGSCTPPVHNFGGKVPQRSRCLHSAQSGRDSSRGRNEIS